MSLVDKNHVPQILARNEKRALILIAVLWTILLLAWVGHVRVSKEPPQRLAVLTSLNPNNASAEELTLLPRIGPKTARKIVDYRKAALDSNIDTRSEPVFRSPDDLQRVKGIGPKTVQRIAPYLHFDES